ncbi:hypothetical protein MMC19_001852 [Ptychographa xylographoides]|nr:hypothetical protein [Ptychographa xylographoides]
MSQKLRASCNACNVAKVRCTKSRPTCSRCAKHGDECVYSVSLRAGKRPAHGHEARFRKFTQPLIGPPSNDARFSENNRNYTEPQESDRRQQLQSPMHSPTADLPTDWTLEPSTTVDLMPLDSDMFLNMVDYDLPSLLNVRSLFDAADCSPPSAFPQKASDLDSLRQSWYQHLSGSIGGPTYMSHEQQSSSAVSTSPSCPTPTTPGQLPSNRPWASNCGCYKTILQTLSSLHIFSSFPNVTFDVALARNKEAVTLCLTALRCTCSADASFGLLFVSLIARILFIYQNSCTAWSNIATATTTTRLTLGVYNLDREDEERIKMELVRMELGKVEALVARLKEKVCYGGVESEVKASEALVGFLECKLRAAFDALQVK